MSILKTITTFPSKRFLLLLLLLVPHVVVQGFSNRLQHRTIQGKIQYQQQEQQFLSTTTPSQTSSKVLLFQTHDPKNHHDNHNNYIVDDNENQASSFLEQQQQRDVASSSRRSWMIKSSTAASAMFLLLLGVSSSPQPALAAADCFKDCLKNCKLIAPKDPDYCTANCNDYCAQDDRTDGLSGSVSASSGEVGILGGTFGQGTVPKGEDKYKDENSY